MTSKGPHPISQSRHSEVEVSGLSQRACYIAVNDLSRSSCVFRDMNVHLGKLSNITKPNQFELLCVCLVSGV